MALPKSNPRVSVSMKMKRVSDAMKPRKTAMAKRGSTLKNKAGRLSKLCDIAVYMIALGADGEINDWPENQQDLKSVLLKYKNLKRGFKDQIEKGLFSVEKGFLEFVDDGENRDLGIQDNCLGAKLESLNERIGAVTMKMMMMRDDGKRSFMDLYKNIMEPDAADQQQQSSLNLNLNLHPTDLVIPTPKPNLIGEINLNLDPGDLVIPTPKPNLIGQINLNLDPGNVVIPTPKPNLIGQFQQDYLSSIHEPTVDANDYLSLVLGNDDHNDVGLMEDYLQLYDLELPEEPQEQLQPQPPSVPSVEISDDDMKLLLSDCEIGLMEDDMQFCDNLDDYEPTVDTIYDFLSWVLGDEDQIDNGVMEDDLHPQSTNHNGVSSTEGLKIDGPDVVNVGPSMSITDDDIWLLLTDCAIGLMQEDDDNDLSDFLAPLETMLLQVPQHQPHSELNLNF
ncbi:PREDICTED: uncharacterized protein LOC103326831 isoform X3 [Prunus mume]|uniref:Uncharacterized protein LOC103326831 isoform X1 n=1 Tax=Prunus mume TaxID=102107 RepID=A0ABM0NN80_PRUMU|nr:PREDICTED: uncharacterized protein LOC103326831 isoform X1 [Prunus mume]XP_008227312.1 PREDICTED: uncharacterized protein LOC103326831 isoform X2 [Prunus mume]XP_016649699.1 PREDICTED: uncharacterized protein LOC103326831 isoform X3 [Prunus mume]